MRIIFTPAFLFFYTLCFGQVADHNFSDRDLNVLSWNVYMLPGITTISKRVKVSHKKKRAAAIAEAVRPEAYDLIVWQETFNWRGRNRLKRKLKADFPFQYGPANFRAISRANNSGVSVFSNFPLTVLEEIDYRDCGGIDCWARKGAFLLQGEKNGQLFQVVGTHLQAGGPDSVKINQVQEIAALLSRHHQDGVPVLICGDMNINSADSTVFRQMLSIYKVDDYPLAGPLQTTNPEKEIDYIFYKPNGTQPDAISRKVRIFEYPWSEEEKWLSNHYAVELRLRW